MTIYKITDNATPAININLILKMSCSNEVKVFLYLPVTIQTHHMLVNSVKNKWYRNVVHLFLLQNYVVVTDPTLRAKFTFHPKDEIVFETFYVLTACNPGIIRSMLRLRNQLCIINLSIYIYHVSHFKFCKQYVSKFF